MATEYLRPLVVKLNFNKQNRTIYKSVGFAGYIGILTAVKMVYIFYTSNSLLYKYKKYKPCIRMGICSKYIPEKMKCV